jgi:VIT1/CCC1 family predicted Fe2+/Mn2+ transporter
MVSKEPPRRWGNRKETEVNTFLWILQIVLCLKLASVAYTHGLRADQAKMQQGMERFGGVARPLLTFVALCAFLGGVGLILPAATGIITWLTPLAAALLALMMLLAVGFHVACRGARHIVVGLILFALAAFVSYGRWVIAPF